MNVFYKIIERFKQRNLLILLLIDSSIIVLSILLSILVRFDFSFPEKILSHFNYYHILLLVMLKIFIFRIFALYRGMWRYTGIWDMFNVIKGNVLATSLTFLIFYFYIGFEITGRSIFFIDLLICTALIGFSRIGVRMFFADLRSLISTSEEKKTRVLIIGAGDHGDVIVSRILKGYSNLKIVAIIDDDSKKIGQRMHGIQVEGPLQEILDFNLSFDEIYICIPSASKSKMRSILRILEQTNKPIKTLPSISELTKGIPKVSQLREVSIIDLLGRDEVKLDESSINNFIKGKRVLITGAGGSIGSELVRQCIKFSPSVLVLVDISELNLFEIERECKKSTSKILFKPILLDIREKDSLDQVFEEYRPQIVFHAAAYKHVPIQEIFPWEAIKTNVLGTHNLVKSSLKSSIESFVLVSTDKAVKPVNVMGATKRLAELIIQECNHSHKDISFMAVRFGNVLGSSGSVIPIFKEQIEYGGPVTVTDPEMERYFMSIPEASQLILQAGSLGKGGEVFILDMGTPIKIMDLASDLIRLSGYDSDDIKIEIIGARPGEKKTEELSNPSENLDSTKHEKIFVLNESINNEKTQPKVLNKINLLEKTCENKNRNEIRKFLSSILIEYKPELAIVTKKQLMDEKNKAKA